MPLVVGAQSALAPAGYSIDNSVRLNGSDEGLVRTSPSDAPTGLYKFTMSFWTKLNGDPNSTGVDQTVTYVNNGTSPYAQVRFLAASGSFSCINYIAATPPPDENTKLVTTAIYEDPGAWMHFVYTFDSTPATPSASSIKMFVNGIEQTEFSTTVYPAQNTVQRMCQSSVPWPIGHYQSSLGDFDGYFAEFMVVDGQALDADQFGEFNEDSPTIWQPIDISGITVGNQGFYLDFKDSANLGNLVLGTAPDFTSTNLAAINQCTDTPTNNFCTMNSLDNYYNAAAFTDGNNKVVTAGGKGWKTGTVGLTAGLWYWEGKDGGGTHNSTRIGVVTSPQWASGQGFGDEDGSYAYYNQNGTLYHNGSYSTYGDSWTTADVIGMYLDLTANKIYFAKNGVIQASGVGYSITAAADTVNGYYFPCLADDSSTYSQTWEMNFGNPVTALDDAAENDSNGYGNFEYSPNDDGSASFDGSAKDFLAICTKNLGSDGG